MSFILNGVRILLIDMYGETNSHNANLINIQRESISNIENDYQLHYTKLNQFWINFVKNKKSNNIDNEMYLSNYRKHCCECNDIALHNCQNDSAKFVFVEEKNEIKYVICVECQAVFFSDFILCHCSNCNIDFYSSILSKNENKNLLIATWSNYHCEKIINEKMKCIKCKSDFYLNLETKKLNCLNPKCKFISDPKKILWTCKICKEEFKNDAIIYNPLQYQRIKLIIQQTLNIKHRAHPKKIPCCKLNVFSTEFYHQKDCDGILYEGELDNKIIIVCEKCKAFNFYDKFIWTCPKCNNRFRDKLIKKKKTFSHLYSKKAKRKNNLIYLVSDRTSYNIYDSNLIEKNFMQHNKGDFSICETEFSINNCNNVKKQKSNLKDILDKRRNSRNFCENDFFISERKDIKNLFLNSEQLIEKYNKNNEDDDNDILVRKKLFDDENKNQIGYHGYKNNIDYSSSNIDFDEVINKNKNDEKRKRHILWIHNNKYMKKEKEQKCINISYNYDINQNNITKKVLNDND